MVLSSLKKYIKKIKIKKYSLINKFKTKQEEKNK